MARIKNNTLIKGTAGAIGKDIVYRTFKNDTFSGKFPDMSAVIPSKNQTKARKRFAEAVAFAKSVMKDGEQSRKNKGRKGNSLYHATIKEYLGRFKPVKTSVPSISAPVKNALQALSLAEPQLRAVAYVCEHQKLSNSNYQQINGVSKATATRHLRELAGLRILKSNGGKGAGAHYIMGSRIGKK
jgi:predicted HTH transcriptional regulator